MPVRVWCRHSVLICPLPALLCAEAFEASPDFEGAKMGRKAVKKVLEALSYEFLGLSRVQIVSVMSLVRVLRHQRGPPCCS